MSAGTGYTIPPTVTLIGGLPVMSTATATAAVNNGVVTGFTITNVGAGYSTFPPTVMLAGGGSGSNFTPATATAVLTNGAVTSITFTGGAGYTSAPTITISPPFSTASALATLSGGSVPLGTITPTSGGSGYTSVPTVTFSQSPGGATATGTATLTNGMVTSITVTNGGSGYGTTIPTITISPPFLQATATAKVSNGVITGFTINNAGIGYTSAPTVTISPSSSVSAAAGLTVTNGMVSAATVTPGGGGSGYTSPPVVTINGDGAGATATAILTNGVVSGFTITNPGSGYSQAATSATIAPPAVFGFTVAAENSLGVIDTTYNGPVTIALGSNPGGATLGGTLVTNAVNGIATFSGLTLNRSSTSNYTIQISSGGLAVATTGPIAVSPAVATQLVVTTQPPANVPAGVRSASASRARMPSGTWCRPSPAHRS